MSGEHPIPFTGEMVRAALNGRKTQTRRVVRGDPVALAAIEHWRCDIDDPQAWLGWQEAIGWCPEPVIWVRCPYGAAGHRLWVRESHYLQWGTHDPWPDLPSSAVEPIGAPPQRCYYREGFDRSAPRWRPSIHMPRWASRITLEVVSVRIERLQDITEADARAEGVRPAPFTKAGRPVDQLHVDAFEILWDRINARRGYPWESSPCVWVIEFRMCDQ